MGTPTKPEFDGHELRAYLEHKWGPVSCQMCRQGTWVIGNSLFELREYHGGAVVFGGAPIVPIIPITCSNCGHTVLINALVAGLLKKNGGSDADG